MTQNRWLMAKKLLGQLSFLLVAAILTLAWVFYFHNDWVAGKAPHWGWLQGTIKALGKHVEVVAEPDEDPDNTKNEIPVHVAKITTGTVHRYIDGFGVVVPRPPRKSGDADEAGSANIASPVAGIVDKVLCQVGQKVQGGGCPDSAG